jgi:Tfp pilus assembly major pilin PilA
MSTVQLSNTATQIDSAIGRVHNAETNIDAVSTSNQNMATAGAIKTAFNNLATTATITTASFTDASLDNEADGVTTSDTAVPTSKAVRDYVALTGLGVATYALTAEVDAQNLTNNVYPVTETSDSLNMGSVDSEGVITLVGGVYQISVRFSHKKKFNQAAYTKLYQDNAEIPMDGASIVTQTYIYSTHLIPVFTIESATNTTFSVKAYGHTYAKDVKIIITKIS